jgi:hypothetical protein
MRSSPTTQRYWAAFLIAALVLLTIPGDLFPARLPAYLPNALLDSYIMRVIAPFPTWIALAILAALLYLKRGAATAETKSGDGFQTAAAVAKLPSS